MIKLVKIIEYQFNRKFNKGEIRKTAKELYLFLDCYNVKEGRNLSIEARALLDWFISALYHIGERK
jgi:hypothetical protein